MCTYLQKHQNIVDKKICTIRKILPSKGVTKNKHMHNKWWKSMWLKTNVFILSALSLLQKLRDFIFDSFRFQLKILFLFNLRSRSHPSHQCLLLFDLWRFCWLRIHFWSCNERSHRKSNWPFWPNSVATTNGATSTQEFSSAFESYDVYTYAR